MKKINVCFVMLIILLFVVMTGISSENNPERILRMALDSMARWDPARASATAGNVPLANIYDTLIIPLPDGTLIPHLAKEWKVSEDGFVYTFFLREGVKFHDGNELTAEDVVFSMKRFLTIGEGFGYLFVGLVEDVKDINKYTVEFTLSKHFGPFIDTLTRFYVVNKNQILENTEDGMYGDMGDYGTNFLLKHDAGSGPYMVKEIIPGEHLYIEQFEDYWGGWDNQFAPTGVKLIEVQEPITIRTMLEKKELEIGMKDMSTESLQSIMKIPGIEIGVYSVGSLWNVTLHNQKAPTDDVNIRKAISCLFDYNVISEKIFPGCPQSMGPVVYQISGHNDELYQYNLDIDKAKEYIKKSKYADSIDQYPIEINCNSTVPDHEKIGLMFQAYGAQAGLKINVTKSPWLNIIEKTSRPESTPHMTIIGVAPAFSEAGSSLYTRYHSNSAGSWQAADWLDNEEIDKMIEDSLGTLDTDERFAKYRKIQEILVNDIVPTVWLADRNIKVAYHADYVFWPFIELIKNGESVRTIHEGFQYYFKDFEIYNEHQQ
jgi:peptide/nickel transport system substrate-binding protein